MLVPRIALALLALIPIAAPVAADETNREIHVPAGWEGAYEFGYAPVLRVGNRVILSGVPNGGDGTYEERTRQMYETAERLLALAGATFADVVEVMTFHRGSADTPAFRAEFDKYMPIHKEFFGDHRPAWTAVGTTVLLSSNADVEMRMEAVVGSGESSRVVFENETPAAGGAVENWSCANDLEVRCGAGACEAAPAGAFTPMRVNVEASGAMSVCAYSGCWEGAAAVVRDERFLALFGHDLPFSTARDSTPAAADVAVVIDRGDGVATLKVGGFAHPLRCERAAGNG